MSFLIAFPITPPKGILEPGRAWKFRERFGSSGFQASCVAGESKRSN